MSRGSNILYPKEDGDRKILPFACRSCDHQEVADDNCVYRNAVRHSAGERSQVLQDVAADGPLPHTKTVCCAQCNHPAAVFFQVLDYFNLWKRANCSFAFYSNLWHDKFVMINMLAVSHDFDTNSFIESYIINAISFLLVESSGCFKNRGGYDAVFRLLQSKLVATNGEIDA